MGRHGRHGPRNHRYGHIHLTDPVHDPLDTIASLAADRPYLQDYRVAREHETELSWGLDDAYDTVHLTCSSILPGHSTDVAFYQLPDREQTDTVGFRYREDTDAAVVDAIIGSLAQADGTGVDDVTYNLMLDLA